MFRYIDDGIVTWPSDINVNLLEELLNYLHSEINHEMDFGKEVTLSHGTNVEKLYFLDVDIVLHPTGNIETDVYYKPTNNHDYLDLHSHHAEPIKVDIPFNPAQRIIVFTSNADTEAERLEELKQWLLDCHYPLGIIYLSFHKTKLQGPAPAPKSKINKLPFVTI